MGKFQQRWSKNKAPWLSRSRGIVFDATTVNISAFIEVIFAVALLILLKTVLRYVWGIVNTYSIFFPTTVAVIAIRRGLWPSQLVTVLATVVYYHFFKLPFYRQSFFTIAEWQPSVSMAIEGVLVSALGATVRAARINSLALKGEMRTRIEVQAALQNQAALLDLARDAIIVRDGKETITFWNRGAEEIYGWTRDEAVGQVIHELLKTRFPGSLADIREQLMMGGRWDGELTQFCKDGREITVTSLCAVERDEAGQLLRILETNREITDRKKIEEGLRASEMRFRTLANSMSNLAWWANGDGYITWYNRRWYEYTGTSPEQMEGWGWQSVHDPKELPRVMAAWKVSIGTGEPFEMTFPLRGVDGGFRQFLTRIVPVKDEHGQVRQWFGTNTDVSEHKLVEEALQRAKLTAEAANQAKSLFLANMSHEIRTPLGAIVGFSELMADDKLSPSDRTNFLSTIKRNSDLLSNIINDILDLSKIEAGKCETEKLEVSIQEVLIDVTTGLSLRAEEKGLALNVSSEGAIPAKLHTDPLRLRQILINIVGNAIKFTNKGTVAVTVKLLPFEGGAKLAFVVSDTGVGISEEQSAKLFVPFTQVDASATRVFGGTGLGLVLSKQLARLLGGDVVLTESAAGVGSTFTITIDPGPTQDLLVETNDGLRAEPRVACASYSQARLQGLRVLVVDDAPDNRMLVTRFLRREGAMVETAENGKNAIEKVNGDNFDVLLMDLQMPVMDGFEAMAALRNDGYKRPVIALTAHAMKEERHRCLSSGFDDHVSKPIDRQTLVDVVAKHGPRASID